MRVAPNPVFAVVLFLCMSMPFAAAADVDPVYTGFFSSLALSGYDTVAYFTEGEAVEGSRFFTTEYQGATWRFKNAEHLALFEASPAAYAPQYGGYCAYAMAEGEAVSAQPDLWTIHNGKLYLNYSRKVNQTWLADKDSFIAKADALWPELSQEN